MHDRTVKKDICLPKNDPSFQSFRPNKGWTNEDDGEDHLTSPHSRAHLPGYGEKQMEKSHYAPPARNCAVVLGAYCSIKWAEKEEVTMIAIVGN